MKCPQVLGNSSSEQLIEFLNTAPVNILKKSGLFVYARSQSFLCKITTILWFYGFMENQVNKTQSINQLVLSYSVSPLFVTLKSFLLLMSFLTTGFSLHMYI